MREIYIGGEVIELLENGSWEEAKLKNNNKLQDVIVLKKNIKFKSTNGKVYDLYSYKNKDIKLGDILYLRLRENCIEEIYESKDDYCSAKNASLECVNKEKNITIILLSAMISATLQPFHKMFVAFMESLSKPQTGEHGMQVFARWIHNATGSESWFFCIGSYFAIFYMACIG